MLKLTGNTSNKIETQASESLVDSTSPGGVKVKEL